MFIVSCRGAGRVDFVTFGQKWAICFPLFPACSFIFNHTDVRVVIFKEVFHPLLQVFKVARL